MLMRIIRIQDPGPGRLTPIIWDPGPGRLTPIIWDPPGRHLNYNTCSMVGPGGFLPIYLQQ